MMGFCRSGHMAIAPIYSSQRPRPQASWLQWIAYLSHRAVHVHATKNTVFLGLVVADEPVESALVTFVIPAELSPESARQLAHDLLVAADAAEGATERN